MEKYENYPWWIITISILQQLAIYLIAGFIIYQFGLIWFLIYLVYFAVLEITFYPRACVYCYYYDKWCFIGKGKVAALFFKKKEPKKFCQRQINFFSMLPEMLVIIVPVILAVILLVRDFNLVILVLIIMDLILVSAGNGFVRGKLACSHCAQGRICCPAREILGKNN